MTVFSVKISVAIVKSKIYSEIKITVVVFCVITIKIVNIPVQ